ncbi:hypothetical protein ZWY2020_044982 [Hordeum vulgare]|nr:hypothetical protein ZWY2020_044982 [Hordeum vulgare]
MDARGKLLPRTADVPSWGHLFRPMMHSTAAVSGPGPGEEAGVGMQRPGLQGHTKVRPGGTDALRDQTGALVACGTQQRAKRWQPLLSYRPSGCLRSSSLDAGGPRVGWSSAEIRHGRDSFADGGTGNPNRAKSSVSPTVTLDGQTPPDATTLLSDSLDMPAVTRMIVARREREEEGMLLAGMGPTSAFIARGGR